MIEETCLKIDELEERWFAERESRYARRNKIRYIDDLLNEFELLNLADEAVIPSDLKIRVERFVRDEQHPVASRGADDIAIAEWLEALFDIQDTLMLPFEDDGD